MNTQMFRPFGKSFLKETSGNVAMIAALSIIPIIGVAGLAVDFQLVVTKKNTVQQTLDVTSIAAARERQSGSTNAQATTFAKEYFADLLAVNDPQLSCASVGVSFVENSEEMNLSVTCTQPTTLSAVLGREKVDFTVESGSTFGVGKVDVAFVFDVSGSMRGSKLSALQDAAEQAFEALLPEDAPTNDDVRIALTSYNHSINAGDYFSDVVKYNTRTNSLGNSEAMGDLYPENYGIVQIDQGNPRNANDDRRFIDYETMSGSTDYAARYYFDSTCVFDRTEDQSLIGGLLGEEIDYYTDDEPDDDNWLYPGQPEWDYLTNRGGESIRSERNAKNDAQDEIEDLDGRVRDRNGERRVRNDDNRVYSNAALSAGVIHDGSVNSSFDLAGSCPPDDSAPLPLTSRQNDLEDYVDDMVANGGTAGHLGIQWGWYLLSPKWDDIWPNASEPLEYFEPETAKAMIIMTDGVFLSTHPRAPADSNEMAARTCDAIKDETNIVIFTIGFETPNLPNVMGTNKDVLEYCATSEGHTFNADNRQELIDTYASIAAEISDLRITN